MAAVPQATRDDLWKQYQLHVDLYKLSLAKTSSDSLRSTEIRQSVYRPKTPSLVGGRATGIVRPSASRSPSESRWRTWSGRAGRLNL